MTHFGGKIETFFWKTFENFLKVDRIYQETQKGFFYVAYNFLLEVCTRSLRFELYITFFFNECSSKFKDLCNKWSSTHLNLKIF